MILLALALAVGVQATFASSLGFSGRNADCGVCHSPASPQEATISLAGWPEHWEPGATYDLVATLDGGPTPLLPQRPQGGFELEVERGTVSSPAGLDHLYRTPRPVTITYEPEGTYQRSWQVLWTAPPATEPPATVTAWLAGVAANGDHDPFLNRSDGGERGDAVATTQVMSDPSPAFVDAWRALPLEPPTIERRTATDTGWRLEGRHQDANATHLVVTRGDIQRRIPTDATWAVDIEGTLDAALHAEGHDRRSPGVTLGRAQADVPAPFAAVPLLGALLARRFK